MRDRLSHHPGRSLWCEDYHDLAKKAALKVLTDDFTKAMTPNRDLEYLWTGRTTFPLRVPTVASFTSTIAATSPPAPPSSCAASSHADELDPLEFPHYGGDEFPDHWPEERRVKAKHYYKAIPEEFYTRSGRRVIKPKNVEKWLHHTSSHKGLRWHFHKLCSGSGRLSLLLMLTGMIVGFPVDSRYGWDIGHAPHQALLQRCHATFDPEHIFGAPSCGPWSCSSSSKDPHVRAADRQSEMPALHFLHETFLHQHNQGRGFTLEQPFSSAMFHHEPISHLVALEEVRKQRLDQCMHGAVDELNMPIRKATAFLSNRKYKVLLKRCDGHRGKAHGVLQGQYRGCTRTALAAVYPKRLCQLLGQDRWRFLRQSGHAKLSRWPLRLLHAGIFCGCERCQLGRAAPPGCEHTLVPGECRYGQPNFQPASAKAAARPARGDLEDPTLPFKTLAKSGDYSMVSLTVHPAVRVSPENRLYLKTFLVQVIQSTINIFSEASGMDYAHWLDDVILRRVIQDVFSSEMNVMGVLISLRPWKRNVPDPHLSSSCAPLRLLISGGIKAWQVRNVEDMREMSHSQLHAEVAEADWHLELFGFRDEDPNVDRPDLVPDARPSSAQPASPFVPAEKKKEGKPPSYDPSSASSSSRPPPAQPLPRSRSPDPMDPAQDPDLQLPQQDGEEFEAVRPEGDEVNKVLKPLFDFKKIYQRLQSDIVDRDPSTAKRLLLGLHERFYRCPISDFKNMLLRAGLPASILPLAEEAIMSCSICRKYVRLPNRPQVKTGAGATAFNDRVQLDLFLYREVWIMLLVDESTRYKAATSVQSKEHRELLDKIFEHWIVIYGAPRQLVMDQETSLMGHEAGREMERFGIERVPKGTTSGAAGRQHTGTGLVERHVSLLEITMQKLEAELDRQGFRLTPHELARESAMSQNQSLNYEGATPCMAVFGVLPRPFYQDDRSGITTAAGALQTDITPFERALRIRQLALSMVHRAVAEDRVARANRTRTHQLKIDEFVPGTTMVDFHREVQGDVGWRGPAELLKIDRAEGTAIISYQGRPYLVSLRHIRHHQAGVFVSFSEDQASELRWFKNIIERMSPYKCVVVGWVPEVKDNVTIWRRSSTTSLIYAEAWSKVVSLSKALSNNNVGGAIAGQSVRAIHPPRGSVGVLIFWTIGANDHGFYEHNNDNPIVLKKVTAINYEKVALLYVYYYVNVEHVPEGRVKVLPSEGYDDLGGAAPMDVDSANADSVPSSSGTMTAPTSQPSERPPVDSGADMEVDPSGETDLKRKGPDSRAVVLAPETKKSKLGLLLEMVYSDKVITKCQRNLVGLYWMMRKTQIVSLEPSWTWWHSHNNHSATALWDLHMYYSYDDHHKRDPRRRQQFLFTWPSKRFEILRTDLRTCEVFKVDTETDVISENDVYSIWSEVDAADAAEVRQFVETNSFVKIHSSAVTEEMIFVDAIWVRKYKRMPSGARQVKSRLCARGCFDDQRSLLTTRSTTATRLSQRMLLSISANEDFDVESWDIGGAFLKGLSFEQVRELLRAKGIRSPTRKVLIIAPANVWRHLAKFDAKFKVHPDALHEWFLLCLKPIYGLNDAPLAWQLCLHGHWEEQGGIQSLMDENLFFWKNENDKVKALVSTHVDDCGAGSKSKWLKEQYELLVKKFGKVTRQTLPFTHCGVLYSRTSDGFFMNQDEFCSKLKPVEVASHKKDDDPLTPSEVTSFRSILGGLLWLTATRLDLVADVCVLQSQVTRAKICHLRQANNVVKRAQAELGHGLGLYFRKLIPPFRLACIHDSSAAGNVRNYAQEGILVLLCEDRLGKLNRNEEHILEDHQLQLINGKGHVLWAHGAKAKRISYSTSHAETLATVSGMETGSLVAVRLAEILFVPSRPSLQSLLVCQEQGIRELPIDHMTDCRDVFELASGEKAIPQDKGQRLYILAIRESRMCNRIRWLILVPTASMTADSLTKSMLSPPMMLLLSSGKVVFWNEEKHKLTLRSLDLQRPVQEGDFDKSDVELRREISTTSAAAASMCALASRKLCFFFVASSLTTLSSASTLTTTSTTTSSSTTSTDDDGDWRWFWTFVLMVLATEWTVLGIFRYWSLRLHEWWHGQAVAPPGPEPEAEHEPAAADLDEANLHLDDELGELRRLLAERDERLLQADA